MEKIIYICIKIIKIPLVRCGGGGSGDVSTETATAEGDRLPVQQTQRPPGRSPSLGFRT